jgi:glutamine amidotransferase
VIAIVDYRAGNLTSVKKALDHLGAECAITSNPDVVARADKIVLPGVGHFAATAVLNQSGLTASIIESTKRGTPFLGICVGMQWMFEGSDEAPDVPGASMIEGSCARFPGTVKSPHVGWNSLHLRSGSRLLNGLQSEPFVYFTHSYRAPMVPATVAGCEYGGEFSAVIERDHLFGVQFHPEKSGEAGLKLLANFCTL